MKVVMNAVSMLKNDGIDPEVIDLRTISPIDKETILNSVAKTHRLAIAHEAVKQGGVGAEIAAIVAEEGIDFLDAPILRFGAPFTPVPFARSLEAAYRVKAEDIYSGIKALFD
jgi:pyruvate dehydrogenase E1 component beta subunit